MTEQEDHQDRQDRRNRKVTLRLTERQFTMIADAAHAARVPLSHYLVELIHETPCPPAPAPIRPGGTLDQLLLQLRGTANNLNQVSRIFQSSGALQAASSPKLIPFLEQLQAQVVALSLEIKKRGEA